MEKLLLKKKNESNYDFLKRMKEEKRKVIFFDDEFDIGELTETEVTLTSEFGDYLSHIKIEDLLEIATFS